MATSASTYLYTSTGPILTLKHKEFQGNNSMAAWPSVRLGALGGLRGLPGQQSSPTGPETAVRLGLSEAPPVADCVAVLVPPALGDAS